MSKLLTVVAICALFTVAAVADDVVVVPAVPTVQIPTAGGAFQMQVNGNYTGNAIQLNHGDSAQNIVGLTNVNEQSIENFPHMVGDQDQQVNLWQTAIACADCGVINALQEETTGGWQYQLIGQSVDPKIQGQALGLVGTQEMIKTDGQGQGSLLQGATLGQSQTAANAAGTLEESTAVTNFQYSAVVGSPGTIGTVGSTVASQTVQSQAVY